MYPNIQPYAVHRIPVGQEHVLYVEECGNLEGIPIVFLHGGPGGCCKPYHRSFFNPQRYRIILFDQRGCGQSTPLGCLANNTTWDLVEDLETLRYQLDIEQWVIFGGSWGATLGLLYAETYPDCVLGLILRGTFLARQRDIEWFYCEGGVSRFFPQQWQAFTQRVPFSHQQHPLMFHYDCLTGKDLVAAHASAGEWHDWASTILSFGQAKPTTETTDRMVCDAAMECHYVLNRCFLEEDEILRHVDRMEDLPAIIVHGQRDLVCPLESAYLLQRQWHGAELRVLPQAGHLSHEPDMLAALVRATDDLAGRLVYTPF